MAFFHCSFFFFFFFLFPFFPFFSASAASSMAALVLPSGWTDAKYGLLAFAFVGELVQGDGGEKKKGVAGIIDGGSLER